MNFKIQRAHEWGGICILWVYDLVKYQMYKDLVQGHGIDPEIFLALDMVTVPFFIMGSARLVNALAGHTRLAWPQIIGWGGLVFVNTILPYAYAGLAGRLQFGTTAWAVFWGLVLFILANLFYTLKKGVVRKRKLLGYPQRESRQKTKGPWVSSCCHGQSGKKRRTP